MASALLAALPDHQRGAGADSRAADAARRRAAPRSRRPVGHLSRGRPGPRAAAAHSGARSAAAADAARGRSVSPGDPAATRRFVEIVREVQASDFTPERLAYLFRHEWEPRRDPGPLPAQVEAVLASIRRGLADAFAETSRPAEVTGDTLRQKLALVCSTRRCSTGASRRSIPRTPPTPRGSDASSSTRHLRRGIFPDAGRRRADAALFVPRRRAGRSPRRRHLESEHAGGRTSISCSSTCCRSCERGSCAARSCRRSSDTLGSQRPGDGAAARRGAALARAAGRAAAARLPRAARHAASPARTSPTPSCSGEPAVVAHRSRADVLVGRRAAGRRRSRPRVQRSLDGPPARAQQGARTRSICRPTAPCG